MTFSTCIEKGIRDFGVCYEHYPKFYYQGHSHPPANLPEHKHHPDDWWTLKLLADRQVVELGQQQEASGRNFKPRGVNNEGYYNYNYYNGQPGSDLEYRMCSLVAFMVMWALLFSFWILIGKKRQPPRQQHAPPVRAAQRRSVRRPRRTQNAAPPRRRPEQPSTHQPPPPPPPPRREQEQEQVFHLPDHTVWAASPGQTIPSRQAEPSRQPPQQQQQQQQHRPMRRPPPPLPPQPSEEPPADEVEEDEVVARVEEENDNDDDDDDNDDDAAPWEGPPPPAKPYIVELLRRVKVNECDIVAHGACTMCLGDFELGTEVVRLPCSHMFHEACIEDWLLDHNCTCPLCVWEFPTDDDEYEHGRKQRMRNRKPRYYRYELERTPVRELKQYLLPEEDNHNMYNRGVLLEKKDLFQHLIDTGAILEIDHSCCSCRTKEATMHIPHSSNANASDDRNPTRKAQESVGKAPVVVVTVSEGVQTRPIHEGAITMFDLPA